MKRLFLIFGLVVSFGVSADKSAKDVELLLEIESDLNGKCQGGSGDNPETQRACEQRDLIVKQLKVKGWCYGEEGQASYQMEWHKCKK